MGELYLDNIDRALLQGHRHGGINSTGKAARRTERSYPVGTALVYRLTGRPAPADNLAGTTKR